MIGGLIIKGGVLMIPIIICSFLCWIIIFERLMYFFCRRDGKKDILKTRELLSTEGVSPALEFLKTKKGIVQTLQCGICQITGTPTAKAEETISLMIEKKIYDAQKGLHLLELVEKLSPLLGFLGTITGMMITFFRISTLETAINPSVLASGIWPALITTAAGLIVSIPAFIFLHFFRNHVNQKAYQMTNEANFMLQTIWETHAENK